MHRFLMYGGRRCSGVVLNWTPVRKLTLPSTSARRAAGRGGMKPIRFHAEARAEVLAAGDWYENKESGLRENSLAKLLLPSSVFKPNRNCIG
jgi:hypothetical protein